MLKNELDGGRGRIIFAVDKNRNSTRPKSLPQVVTVFVKLQNNFGTRLVLNPDFPDLNMLIDHQCLLIQDLSVC